AGGSAIAAIVKLVDDNICLSLNEADVPVRHVRDELEPDVDAFGPESVDRSDYCPGSLEVTTVHRARTEVADGMVDDHLPGLTPQSVFIRNSEVRPPEGRVQGRG